ncbi:hypothetical protein OG596_38655 (plasmid) [Streptomyces sp. NBC_01102]|uniref:hypothetical protein n=1 Tax=Streptomyces sp. NBC_01102 TaxID=2903749 RepID=UPI003868130A|nr:hypothetical protein OG596_38655 [Streptomyces sp. NBC_01102]
MTGSYLRRRCQDPSGSQRISAESATEFGSTNHFRMPADESISRVHRVMGNRCTLHEKETAVVKNHGKKSRAKAKARRTGAAHASAAAGTLHTHEPLPDVSILPLVPHGSWRLLDLDLAARLVAACRAECRPCQQSLAQKTVAQARPTLAALAGAIYGTLPTTGLGASAPTREWAPLARAATEARTGDEAFAAVDAMTDTAAAALLEDALDHWSAGDPMRLANIVKLVAGGEAPPRKKPADPMDTFRNAGINVFTLDDLDLGDDIDPYHLAENYGVFPGQTTTPEGPMPMLTLFPESDGAGIEDLEARTDWEHWGLYGMPDKNPRWLLRARASDRSLQGLVHVGTDGKGDDTELWRAAQTVSLPADWWALLNRVQHILVVGPVKEPEHQALQAAGDAGELLAVVARVEIS